MDGHQNYTIERFVVEACEVLQIPLRRPSPTELELRVPPGLRRYFGNLDSVRTTTSSELRRLDPELDLLGPRSFAVECLSELLSGSESTWGVLVAGVPERVDPERYVRSFADRFLPAADCCTPGEHTGDFLLECSWSRSSRGSDTDRSCAW